MYTLAQGARARQFGYIKELEELTVYTGKDFSTAFCIFDSDIEDMLSYFCGKGWAVLGNQIDAVKFGGIGDYFKSVLKESPKFASHICAYLAENDRLLYRDDNGYLEFKVKQEGGE